MAAVCEVFENRAKDSDLLDPLNLVTVWLLSLGNLKGKMCVRITLTSLKLSRAK
jgi:hypothetical protein